MLRTCRADRSCVTPKARPSSRTIVFLAASGCPDVSAIYDGMLEKFGELEGSIFE